MQEVGICRSVWWYLATIFKYAGESSIRFKRLVDIRPMQRRSKLNVAPPCVEQVRTDHHANRSNSIGDSRRYNERNVALSTILFGRIKFDRQNVQVSASASLAVVTTLEDGVGGSMGGGRRVVWSSLEAGAHRSYNIFLTILCR